MTSAAIIWIAFGFAALAVCVDAFSQGQYVLSLYMLASAAGDFWLAADNIRLHRGVEVLKEDVHSLEEEVLD